MTNFSKSIIYLISFILINLINQSNCQFSCATHECGQYMDRSCLKVRNAMLGVVRSEFVGNNCACCVNRRSGRVAEAGVELQKNIVADVKAREFRYASGKYCQAYACGGIYDSVCAKLVADAYYPAIISRNVLCQCCITPSLSQPDIDALFNRHIVDLVWKKESISS